MIDFINSTFPFAKALENQGSVNIICRYKTRKQDDPCPFAFLSALAFSSSMFLSKLPDFEKNLEELAPHVISIRDVLRRNSRSKKDVIARSVRRQAHEKAQLLFHDLYIFQNREHPTFRIIEDATKKILDRNQEIDDLIESIKQIYVVVTELLGAASYVESENAKDYLSKLKGEPELLALWKDALGQLSKRAKNHPWPARDKYLANLEIEAGLDDGDKQRALETKLKERITDMWKDDNCVFAKIIVKEWGKGHQEDKAQR